MSVFPILQRWKAITDPVAFGRSIGFKPDEWQEQLLAGTMRRSILCCGRQTGKSTTTAVIARHVAETIPGSLTLMGAPAFRQSIELFRKLRDFKYADDAPARLTNNAMSLELSNGSRIVALPGKDETIRSFGGVDLLIIDEAAYVGDRIFAAVSPMVATSNGRVILLSTPRSMSGFFFQVWSNGNAGWARYHIPSSACPRIPASFLEDERHRLPEFVYKREYEAQFTDSADALVRTSDIDSAFDGATASLYSGDIVDPNIRTLDGLIDASFAKAP